MALKLHSRGQIYLLVLSTVLTVPLAAFAQGGRHVSPTDRPPAGQQGPDHVGYGRATIYRSGEMPKPADESTGNAKLQPARTPRPARGHQLEVPAPVIIQGVPHRFHLHYSQSTC